MKKVMGPDFLQMAAEAGLDIDGMAALVPLSVALHDERKRRGISFARAARALKARQHQLKTIEAGVANRVDGPLLARYAEWLGLFDYLRQWAKAQPALAQRLGLPADLIGLTHSPPSAGDMPMLFPDMPLSAPPPTLLPAGHTFPLSSAPGDDSFAGIELLKKFAEGDPVIAQLMGNFMAGLTDDDLEMFDDPCDALLGPAADATYEFEITLRHVKPRIWRRFRVSNSLSLARLHDVVQAVMGWEDCHLHTFRIAGEQFSRPVPGESRDFEDERKFRLADLGLREKDEMLYEYDFGDGWEHRLVLKKILPHEADAPPVCIKGVRACPPEDCGGPWGYANLLEAVGNRAHPEHEELRDWIGEDFNPERFEVAHINADLAAMAKRWVRKRSRKRRND
jgi:hypothetical protein